jgi:hypothetical protein
MKAFREQLKPIPCCLLAARKVLFETQKIGCILVFGTMMWLENTRRSHIPTLWHLHIYGDIEVSLQKGRGVVNLPSFEL